MSRTTAHVSFTATLLAALAITGCHASHHTATASASANASAQPAAPNTLTAAERAAGWRLLFDGTTTNGWRGYQMTAMPPEWMAMDGTLMKSARAEDIVTKEMFGDFDLTLEWKLAARGNAGIFYRATEEYNRVYWSAPEYQLADSLAPDSRSVLTSAGAVYGFYPAIPGTRKPADQWNTTRIVAKGTHVEHWLNGVKIAEYEYWSPEFTSKFQASKFKEYANFARATRGLIAIQGDHNGMLALRNIKIRELR